MGKTKSIIDYFMRSQSSAVELVSAMNKPLSYSLINEHDDWVYKGHRATADFIKGIRNSC